MDGGDHIKLANWQSVTNIIQLVSLHPFSLLCLSRACVVLPYVLLEYIKTEFRNKNQLDGDQKKSDCRNGGLEVIC